MITAGMITRSVSIPVKNSFLLKAYKCEMMRQGAELLYIYICIIQVQFICNTKHKEILKVIYADSLLRMFQYNPLRPAGLNNTLNSVHTRSFLDLKPEEGYLPFSSSLVTSVQCRQPSVSQCYSLRWHCWHGHLANK